MIPRNVITKLLEEEECITDEVIDKVMTKEVRKRIEHSLKKSYEHLKLLKQELQKTGTNVPWIDERLKQLKDYKKLAAQHIAEVESLGWGEFFSIPYLMKKFPGMREKLETILKERERSFL